MNRAEKTLILVNPAAGGGRRAHRVQRLVADYFTQQGHPADFAVTQDSADLEQRARAGVAEGRITIAVIGGDGTFQHLVRATLGSSTALGFLPAGGGNDVAAALGIPADPIEAARVFLRSQPRLVDVLQAKFSDGSSAIYLGGGGMGLDAESARLSSGRLRRLPGASRYIAAALYSLVTFKPLAIEVELDGRQITGLSPVLLAAVANTPTYGAGVWIAPAAQIDDGLLDLVLVADLPWSRLLELIPLMLQSGEVRGPEIRRFQGRRVRLCPARPAVFHGDGELLGAGPVEIENLPGAIRVLAPMPR